MKKYTAELIGTFALVFVGAGAGAMNELLEGRVGLIGVALAHGLILVGMIYALGHISGIHINPAVTVAMRATGRISTGDMIGYIIAQLIGAAIAGFILRSVFNPALTGNHIGFTGITKGVPVAGGFMLEAIGTFLFFTVIFGAAVDGRTAGNLAGLAIGLTLASLILFIGPLTGASFNPARSFGPALALGDWSNFWIYIAGPIVGGCIAGWIQTAIFIKPQPVEPQASSYKP